jgi:hypothetical protein
MHLLKRPASAVAAGIIGLIGALAAVVGNASGGCLGIFQIDGGGAVSVS